jgi:tetratricopeptide (TPR) repeat protein
MLYERGIYPASTYIFKHALTREVVYDSILSKNRKQLHSKIAHAIEEIYGDNICDCYGILSNHCMASDEYEKSAEYARLEARKCQKAASFKDAIEYAKRIVGCIEKLPQTGDVQKRLIDARVRLSTYCLNLNYQIEAKNAVEPVIQLALDLNYQKSLPGIYAAMGQYHIWVEEDFSKGSQYLKDVFKIAAKAGDFVVLWFANFMLGNFVLNNYQFDESMACFKTCLDLSTFSNRLAGISSAKSGLAVNYILQGKTDLALQISKEAMDTAADSGDIVVMQFAYTSRGLSSYFKGLFLEAEKYLLEGLSLYGKASAVGWRALAAGFLSFAYEDMGEYEKAEEYHQICISILEDEKFTPSWQNVHKLFLTKIKILKHRLDIKLKDLNAIIASHEKNKLAVCESFGTRCIAEIYMHIDDQHMAEAEAWIKRAIDFNTKHETKWELARDYVLYADWFQKKANMSKARENLTTAIGLFKECGADGWVEKYEKDLINL